MKTELYRAIKGISKKDLDEGDKYDLLALFNHTNNDLLRDQIAFIFSDINFSPAVPSILEKINAMYLANKNGSLVHSLEAYDLRNYFIDIVQIICKHEYEPRLIAFGIVEDLLPQISTSIKEEALKIVETYLVKIKLETLDAGENSLLHFVEKTRDMIYFSINKSV